MEFRLEKKNRILTDTFPTKVKVKKYRKLAEAFNHLILDIFFCFKFFFFFRTMVYKCIRYVLSRESR